MCEQRERLIGYVYGDCEAAERQQIEDHLADCHVCRQEIGALRSVRQDLLAWNVPEHDPVWRPVVPARPAPTWRDVPAWGLAAAASFLFLAGAAGGVATRVWFPAQALANGVVAAAAPAASAPAPPAAGAVTTPAAAVQTTATPSLSSEQMAALEQRVMDGLSADLDARVKAVATSMLASSASHRPQVVEASSRQAATGTPTLEEIDRQLREISNWRREQVAVNVSIAQDIKRLSRNSSNASDLWPVSLPVALQGASGR